MTKYLLTISLLIGLCTKAQVQNDTIPKDKEGEELQEIIIQSTGTNRSFKNTPTRLEVIDAEELDEKGNMQASAGVTMVLNESTGLQVQQTSASTGNASVRVQGLDARYTQILKDGYPSFGNFAGGLSLMQIPPLDLKQVEVIKGPASTLYGGGAIAGTINFISKKPNEVPENILFFNQSHIGQTSFGVYTSQRKKYFGYSFLILQNIEKAYDADRDNFSEIPKSNTFTVDPKLYFYPTPNSSIMIGNSFSTADLKGGDMHVIAGNADSEHVYFEQNKTVRNVTTLEYNNSHRFRFKQSLSFFDRKINIPTFAFSGLSTNTYSDASYVWEQKNQTVVAGLNAVYDDFKERGVSTQNARSFTTGIYVQHTWDVTENIKLENGVRLDNVHYSNILFAKNQTFLLPKVSALFKINNQFSSRIGGGLGYKIPTIFTEKTEERQYQNVLPLNNVKSEQSIGGTADINFRTRLGGETVLAINQMFYLTQINKPLVLTENTEGQSYFVNAASPVISKGFETNVKFTIEEDFKIFIGYTFTEAKAGYLPSNQVLPLLPKNKILFTTVYEKERNFKFGFEGYFSDRQYLSNRSRTPEFWTFGLMAQKTMWKHFDFFVNFENLTDVKQSDYKRVVNEPALNPTFDEIWTHTEGFVFNGGVRIKF